MTLLSIQEVWKSFGDHAVLKGVSLEVQRGQVACLIGRSGSGKTTLLRCVNHLERFDSGSIWVDGESVGYELRGAEFHERREADICRMRSQVGMVFQQFNLFSHKTALQNVIEGPIRVRGLNRATAEALGRELLERVGLGGKLHSYPRQLSGGQQQRVAIARALAMDPKLILFDEPTSALDPELVGEVLGVMRELANDGMTMLVVTHELGFARDVADIVVFMHDGEILEQGRPERVLSDPQHPALRSFLSLQAL